MPMPNFPHIPPFRPFIPPMSLPAVYGDELSYMELLGKAEKWLSDLVESNNLQNAAIVALYAAWDEFKNGGYTDSFEEFLDQWFADNQEHIDELLTGQFADELAAIQETADGAVQTANEAEQAVAGKVNMPTGGTNGQVLSKADTSTGTSWVDPIIPTDEQTETYITKWLNEHPEATTTVQDHSITEDKLAIGLGNTISEEWADTRLVDWLVEHPEAKTVQDGYINEILSFNGTMLLAKDLEWEMGTLGDNGEEISSNTRIRTKNLIYAKPNSFVVPLPSCIMSVKRYSKDGTFIEGWSTSTEPRKIVLESYIRIVAAYQDSSAITVEDAENVVYTALLQNTLDEIDSKAITTMDYLPLEQGGIAIANGELTESDARVRTSDYIEGPLTIIAPKYCRIICVAYYNKGNLSFNSSVSYLENLPPITTTSIGLDGCVAKVSFASYFRNEPQDAISPSGIHRNLIPENTKNFIRSINDFMVLDKYPFVYEKGHLSSVPGHEGEEIESSNLRTRPVFLNKGTKIILPAGYTARLFKYSGYGSSNSYYISHTEPQSYFELDQSCWVRLSPIMVNGNEATIIGTIGKIKVWCEQKPNKEMLLIDSSLPSGWNVCDSVHFHTIYSVGLSELYARFDELVSSYPDYVSKEAIGRDSSDTYTIYSYTFSPTPTPSNVQDYDQMYLSSNSFPKFILLSLIHGNEFPGNLALTEFAYKLCHEWESNETLGFLRWNAKFVMIPVANPWGFVHGTRVNSNHVDLNRNFDTSLWDSRWASDDPQSDNYRGPYPSSEGATNAMVTSILRNNDAAALLDFHAHGMLDLPKNMTSWSTAKPDEGLDDISAIQSVGNEVIRGTTRSAIVNHSVSPSLGIIGNITTQALSGVSAYANKMGIPACSPEVMYRIWRDDGATWNDVRQDSYMTDDARELNVEFVLNSIIGFYRRLNN